MKTNPIAATDRRRRIAEAALDVLETEGGRGLTHRAVDRRAGLPLGSTSNYHATREGLLTAALDRLVELERPSLEALEALVPDGPFAPPRAAELVADLVESWVAPSRVGLAVARYELILEARRRPEFQVAFSRVQSDYLRRCERLLPTAGCRAPRSHAPQLLATLDGLTVNQALAPATALSRRGLVEVLERFFESC